MIGYKEKRIKGFTLVEALVAISILMVAVVSPMTIAQKGLNSAMYSKDQMTAAFLAQDAIEFIKNWRDMVGLNKDPDGNLKPDWLSLPDICTAPSSCDIDTTRESINPGDIFKDSSTGNPLRINKAGPLFVKYDLTGTEVSKFSRDISVTKSAGGDEAKISVRVSWLGQGGVSQNVVVENYIYNYWENL